MLWEVDGNVDLDKKIFGGYIKSTVIKESEEKWFEMLEQVKKYIDENDKRPSDYDKNNDIKRLGQWVCKQVSNYKKQSYIMKNNKIRKEWEKIICDYKKYFLSNEEQWNNTLIKVKEYIDENKKRPSLHDKKIGCLDR